MSESGTPGTIDLRRVKVIRMEARFLLEFMKHCGRNAIHTFSPLPSDARVIGVAADSDRLVLTLYVESAAFEPVPDGDVPDVLRPTVTVFHPDGETWRAIQDARGIA